MCVSPGADARRASRETEKTHAAPPPRDVKRELYGIAIMQMAIIKDSHCSRCMSTRREPRAAFASEIRTIPSSNASARSLLYTRAPDTPMSAIFSLLSLQRCGYVESECNRFKVV